MIDLLFDFLASLLHGFPSFVPTLLAIVWNIEILYLHVMQFSREKSRKKDQEKLPGQAPGSETSNSSFLSYYLLQSFTTTPHRPRTLLTVLYCII